MWPLIAPGGFSRMMEIENATDSDSDTYSGTPTCGRMLTPYAAWPVKTSRRGNDKKLMLTFDMAYKPNPFVDPDERGFNLPAGCKDLNDLLALHQKESGLPLSGVETGTVHDVRSHLYRLYAAKCPRLFLFVTNLEREALLVLIYAAGSFRLALRVPKPNAFLFEAIVELFGDAALATSSKQNEVRTIHIPLPEFWDDAAQPVIDLLIRGYGLSETARLLFHFKEEKRQR